MGGLQRWVFNPQSNHFTIIQLACTCEPVKSANYIELRFYNLTWYPLTLSYPVQIHAHISSIWFTYVSLSIFLRAASSPQCTTAVKQFLILPRALTKQGSLQAFTVVRASSLPSVLKNRSSCIFMLHILEYLFSNDMSLINFY